MPTAMAVEQNPEQGVDLRRLAPGDAARLLDIVLTFARHGVVVVVRRGPFLAVRPRRRAPRAAAVAVRRSFADLGPTFVKLGQLVASSPGLFPDVLSQECRRLLDRVPPVAAGTVRRIVEAELGRPVGGLFAEFADEPLACASVAQVHAAELVDGTRVAVKVRRPRLRRRIEQDLRLLRLCAVLLEQAGPVTTAANPAAIVDDFATTIRAELDLRNEAAWMVEFEHNLRSFGSNSGVVVPRPVPEMVARRVLVMTYVDGTPIDQADWLVAAGYDPEEVLLSGVRAWIEGALVHGLFHGDVHAGNLFVTPQARVAFLDFGIMGRLDERIRSTLREALPRVLLSGDFNRAAEVIVQLGVATRPVDLDALADEVRALVTPLIGSRISDIRYGEILDGVVRVALRHHLRVPRELVLIAKQILYFERYAKALAPDHALLSDTRILQYLVAVEGPA